MPAAECVAINCVKSMVTRGTVSVSGREAAATARRCSAVSTHVLVFLGTTAVDGVAEGVAEGAVDGVAEGVVGDGSVGGLADTKPRAEPPRRKTAADADIPTRGSTEGGAAAAAVAMRRRLVLNTLFFAGAALAADAEGVRLRDKAEGAVGSRDATMRIASSRRFAAGASSMARQMYYKVWH